MTSLLLLKSMLFAKALKKTHTQKKKKHKIKKPISAKVSVTKCRICNQEKGDIPIFNNKMQPEIPDEITHFSGVFISNSDHFSKYMCQSCLDLLNGCIMFRDMCQRNNEIIIQMPIKTECRRESEDSYNIPSPTFSDGNTEIWGCTTCSEQFLDMVSYNTHLTKCKHNITENVTGPDIQKPPEEVTKRKFLCDVCGKTAFSNANLLVHMATHENIFPFKCDNCPYQGRTMDLLKVHKRTHLSDKPFKCTQCPKATTTASNLKKHMRHVHSTTRPYKCTFCDKAFSYQHDMKRHIKDIHLRQGTVECDLCKKKFNTKKILQGHRWKVHKIKGERQGRLPSYLLHQMEPNENTNPY